ncbi:hypothetical protein BDV38DRAFT_241136, partial [Aspergillus pseudotamarii]
MSTMCSKSNYTSAKWWKDAVVYHVYPASFNNGKPATEGNGWGDVTGIIDKVPYVRSLGVDIVWLSPSESIFCRGTEAPAKEGQRPRPHPNAMECCAACGLHSPQCDALDEG